MEPMNALRMTTVSRLFGTISASFSMDKAIGEADRHGQPRSRRHKPGGVV